MAAPRPDAGIAGDLYDYVARRYDPVLARFIQPDTIVPNPGDPQSLNRYSYVGNNPLRYTDPSGHCENTPDEDDIGCWLFARKFANEYQEKGVTYEELSQYTIKQLERYYNGLEAEDARNMNPPSAHGIGASVDGGVEFPAGFFTIKGTIGMELIFNHETGEKDIFLIGGIKANMSLQNVPHILRDMAYLTDALDDLGKLKVGAPKSLLEAGGDIYISEYENLPSNDLATGLNNITSVSARAGVLGVNYAQAYSTYDPNGPRSVSIGWSPGIGYDLSVDESAIRYFKLTR